MNSLVSVVPVSLSVTKNHNKLKKSSTGKQSTKQRKHAPVSSRIEITDNRRVFSQLLLNAFNSCDINKLQNTFNKHCTPDLYASYKYEGISNPYAPNFTEMKTIENHIEMWSALIKSAPDFLFLGEFIEAYQMPNSKDKRCVVRSKFTFSGTRILDVKIANQVNEEIIKNKLDNKDDVRQTIIFLCCFILFFIYYLLFHY